MRKKITVVMLSLVTALSGIAPAQAFPSISAPKIEAPLQVQNVQYWRDGPRLRGRDRWERRGHYRHRYYGHRYRDRYYGHRYHRRYDRGPNVGAVIGGLAAGAIIGGALAQPRYSSPRRYVGGNSHVSWCYSRYRSYRAYDNTFQPYNGPRRQCHSPY